MLRAAGLVFGLVLLFSSLGGCAYFKHELLEPKQFDFGIIEDRLSPLRPLVRDDVRITVGNFSDKTGQYKDSDTLRYSRAVTQGGADLLSHLLYRALGPGVLVERDPHNLGLIEKEYGMTFKFDSEGRHIGLVQRAGPRGGLSGAQYLVTGSILYYNVDRYTGGGGFNIQGFGVSARFATALVTVELRLVDMGSSEVLWSTIQQSGVDGYRVGADIFRFITSGGESYLVQAELGMAAQLPADYAFHTSLEESVARMILENEEIFINKDANDVQPDTQPIEPAPS